MSSRFSTLAMSPRLRLPLQPLYYYDDGGVTNGPIAHDAQTALAAWSENPKQVWKQSGA